MIHTSSSSSSLSMSSSESEVSLSLAFDAIDALSLRGGVRELARRQINKKNEVHDLPLIVPNITYADNTPFSTKVRGLG